ncbi:unnamed protein product [Somion occarium]|uniref:Amidase domain-containing protein n=1 Tax=Somion occarium TaxID=3059160 RepID=A0ABP1DMU2_9APHY
MLGASLHYALATYVASRQIASDVSAKKQQDRAEKIARLTPKYSAPLTEEDQRILGLSLTQLVGECNDGAINPSSILSAHGKKCLAAQESTNCLTDFMFEEGLSKVTTNRPLSGVPVSIKDCFDVEGHDTTLGFSSKANQPVPSSASIVQLLQDAGALIHVKTAVPTGMFSFETKSDLFGETSNPYNPKFAAGASTGGGAALLAYHGSKIEIASDIGGSVRFPPAYCGVYGMKASWGRFPAHGSHAAPGGMESIQTIPSPMAKTLEDLISFWERVVGMKPWEYDHTCVPIPWRPVDFVLTGKKPKWGVIWDDGIMPATPACERGLKSAVESLRKLGHEVIDFQPPSILEVLKTGFQFLSADGADTIAAPLSPSESLSDPMMEFRRILKMPLFAKRLMASLLRMLSRPAGRNDAFAALSEVLHPMSVAEERALVLKREEQKAAWTKAFKDQGVDFILTIAHPLPPVLRGKSGTATLLSASSAFLFNVLDFTAGVVPVTFVDRWLDALPDNFQETEAYGKLNDAARNMFSCYDAVAMDGLPIAVQVVGRRFEEEKVLEGMKAIETALKETDKAFVQREFY